MNTFKTCFFYIIIIGSILFGIYLSLFRLDVERNLGFFLITFSLAILLIETTKIKDKP